MNRRLASYSLATILVLVFSLFSPVIAMAEGEPPPEPGTGESLPEGGEATSLPEPSAEEGGEATSLPDSLPPETEAPDMILVDEEIEAVLIVSEDAAPALNQSDPIWCPGTDLPGSPSCTTTQASVTDLIAYLLDPDGDPLTDTPYTGAGTIYFQNGDYTGLETGITFDKDVLADLTDLRLEGGWDLATYTEVDFGYTAFDAPFLVDWGFALELQDLIISAQYDGYSLYIVSEDDVTLDNVEVIDNDDGSGAYIDTCLMQDIDPDPEVEEWACTGTGDVLISFSTFDDNGGDGLWVESGGDIELFTVSASDNGLDGAGLDNSFGSGGVIVSSSIFNENDSTGLAAWTDGVISLDHIRAELNSDGAILSAGDEISAFSSYFSENAYGGLWAYTSSGSITLLYVTASDNMAYGALAGTEVGDIEIEGGNYTNNLSLDPEVYGYGVGLEAGTLLGNVNLLNVTASGNDIGARVGTADGDVLIEFSTFMDNTQIGLETGTMTGALTLVEVVAGNTVPDGQEIGAHLLTLDGPIDVIGGSYNNNLLKGLYIESTGGMFNLITLEDVEAIGNGAYGAYLTYVAPCGTTTGGLPILLDGGVYQNNGAYGISALIGPEGAIFVYHDPDFGSDETTWNGTPPDSLYGLLMDNSVIACPPECPPEEPKDEPKPFNIVEVPGTGGLPVEQDCANYSGTILILPTGNKIFLVCPATGTVDVKELVESGLPGVLPGGPAFLSALEIILMDGDEPIPVITNGGYITVAFKLPEDASPSDRFAILYWDPAALDGAGDWVELPEYREVFPGISTVFPLHPDADPDDMMRILAGSYLQDGYIKADVTFPGVFVLIKR